MAGSDGAAAEPRRIVFGSRGSDLALSQSRTVAALLEERSGHPTHIEVISTRGDRELSKPLPEIGGKGLFTAELESALLDGSIDIAVHSLKDLPVEDPKGLTLGAVPPRAAVHDVLICRVESVDPAKKLVPLAHGAKVGTSSLRRAGALRLLRPDLQFADVRGNVPTRVEKVARGEYDAVVLAAAGLDRLDFVLPRGLVRLALPVDMSPPAPGQGALGVQCRADDDVILSALALLHDEASAASVHAERDVLARLGGGCSMPLGAIASRRRGGEHRLHCGLFARGNHRGGIFRTAVGEDLAALTRVIADELELFVEPVDAPVVLARPDGEPGSLGDALAVACPQLRVIASTKTERVLFDVGALRDAGEGVLAFTSARAVHEFFAARQAHGIEGEDAARGAFAVGPATAAALGQYGLDADTPADAAGGERLARYILDSGVDVSETIAFPCAADRHRAFESILQEAGRDVRPLPIYRSVPNEDHDFGSLDGSVLVCTSPSGVASVVKSTSTAGCVTVALGETTEQACLDAGMALVVRAASPTAEGVVQAIREAAVRLPERKVPVQDVPAQDAPAQDVPAQDIEAQDVEGRDVAGLGQEDQPT